VPFLPTPKSHSFNIMAAVSEALKKASQPEHVRALNEVRSPTQANDNTSAVK
jgi:hypothetical protein